MSTSDRMRVLVLEHRAALRESLVAAILARSHSVTPVDSLEEAARWIASDAVDLVVADLLFATAADAHLPNMLRNSGQPVPFVLTTTSDDVAAIDSLRGLTADVLTHPVTDAAIDGMIEKARAYHLMHAHALKVFPFATVRVDFVIPSRVEFLDGILAYLGEHAVRLGIIKPQNTDLLVALDEAIVNAIKHGNGYDERKRVRIEALLQAEQATFVVTDEGAGFRPHEVPDPLAEENLLRPSGRGLLLIRTIMDEVNFNETGNSITMLKKREG
jgi:serine/threonine-protein kinase RsbW